MRRSRTPLWLLSLPLAAWTASATTPPIAAPPAANGEPPEREVCQFPATGAAFSPSSDQGLARDIAAWSGMAQVPVRCGPADGAAPQPAVSNPPLTAQNPAEGFSALVVGVVQQFTPEQRPEGMPSEEKARVMSQAVGLVVQASEQAGPEHPAVRRMMDIMDLFSQFLGARSAAPSHPRGNGEGMLSFSPMGRPGGDGGPNQRGLAAALNPGLNLDPGRWMEAEGQLKDLASQFPQNFVPREALGKGLFDQRRYSEAIQQLSKAIELGSRDPDIFYLRGAAAEKLGDYAAAYRDAAAALALDPHHLRALTMYKLTGGRAGSRDQGSAAHEPVSDPEAVYLGGASDRMALAPRLAAGGPLLNAVASAPPAPRPAGLLAVPEADLLRSASLALASGDARAALQGANRILAASPENSGARYLRAAAQLKLKNYVAAVQDSSWVLSRSPDHSATLNIRSLALNKLGRYDPALNDAVAAVRLKPDNAVAYHNKAFAEAGLHRRANAVASLGLAARYSPAFSAEYRAARELPEDKDLLFLFVDPGSPSAERPVPAKKVQSFWLFLVAWFGGAIAMLWVFQATLRSWMKASAPARAPGPAKAAPRGAASARPFHERYEIVRVLGSGGMGVVYEALDRGLMRKVAIKKMRGEIRSEERARARFLAEARTVASLRHPNIVEIHSIEEEGADVFLVFEYLEAVTLQEMILGKKRLDLPEALRIFRSVCKALDYAHRRNIIHRDLKPLNIMVDKKGVPKIMDFGFARTVRGSMNGKATSSRAYGTRRYMAPEQERGSVCKESDLFSLGVTLYEALTGASPFHQGRPESSQNKLTGTFTPASSLVSDLPEGLDAFFTRAFDPDAANRFHTPVEFFNELAAVVTRSSNLPVHPLNPEPAPPAQPSQAA